MKVSMGYGSPSSSIPLHVNFQHLSGGAHGYLGAILTAVEYATATPINTPPFVDPPFLVPQPSSHPTALDLKYQSLNGNSTKPSINGLNTKISPMLARHSFKMALMICI